MAEARVASPANISPQLPKDLLDVIITGPCSYLLEISWKKRLAASLESGRYPSSSIIIRSSLQRDASLSASVLVE